MFGAEVTTDSTSFLGFVEEAVFVSRESQCICLNVLFFPFCKAGDDCRIDSATKKDAERNITNKLSLHGRRECFLDVEFQLFV